MTEPLKLYSENEPAALAGDISQQTWTIPRLLTQREASVITRKSEKWFERDRGVERRIPFVKIGRSVRYRAEDIDAFIKANTRTASR